MQNRTEDDRQICPEWCTAHVEADTREDYRLPAEHRWHPTGAAEWEGSDTSVYIFQIVDSEDAPMLSWYGESHEPGAAVARAFAGALDEAVDKLDEIRGAISSAAHAGSVVAENMAAVMADRSWDFDRLSEESGIAWGDLVSWRADASTMGIDSMMSIAMALQVPASRLVASRTDSRA